MTGPVCIHGPFRSDHVARPVLGASGEAAFLVYFSTRESVLGASGEAAFLVYFSTRESVLGASGEARRLLSERLRPPAADGFMGGARRGGRSTCESEAEEVRQRRKGEEKRGRASRGRLQEKGAGEQRP